MFFNKLETDPPGDQECSGRNLYLETARVRS